VAVEWFRTSDWGRAARDDFEQRLRRARQWNRPQYLRIKALALAEHGGRREAEGARELLMRLIEEYPDAGDVVIAHEQLAELDEREGRRLTALEHYRAALQLAPERNYYGDAALRLPELLIDSGRREQLAEAEAVLQAVEPADLVFASQRFRYAVARARLARAAENPLEATRYAEAALQVAASTTPDFSRHPTVGLVQPDEATLDEMRELAGR
jgi:tetratricopeptide (TPR) repeat protein